MINKNMNIASKFDFLSDTHCKFLKIHCDNNWIDVITDKNGHSEPAFSTIDQVRKGLRSQDHLAVSVLSQDNKTVIMVLQLERLKKDNTKKKPFSFIDELIARILVNVLSYRIDYEDMKKEICEREQKAMVVIRIISDMLSANTQPAVVSAMRKNLPKFHGFEELGLIYYNPTSNQLYTIQETTTSKGETIFGMSYPTTLGICGEIVRKHALRIKDKTSDLIFNGDVDNIQSVKLVKNYLYGPLFKQSGELLAIAQFINKIGEGEVGKADIELFEIMGKLYSLIIEKNNEKLHVLHTLIGLKGCSDYLDSILPKEDYSEDNNPHLTQIAKSMRAAKAIINDSDQSNREDIIEELIRSIK